jgi:hypothetical protein
MERDLLVALAEAGVSRPELGFESAGGIPIAIAWPDRLVAVDYALDAPDRDELKTDGWTVCPLDQLIQGTGPVSFQHAIS